MSIILYKPHIGYLFLFTIFIFTTFTRIYSQKTITVISSSKIFFERYLILTLHYHTLRVSRKFWLLSIS